MPVVTGMTSRGKEHGGCRGGGSRTQGPASCTPTSRPTPVAGSVTALRDQILARLKQGWSPEQVGPAGKRVNETIYRFIYAQLARKKDPWRHPPSASRNFVGEGTPLSAALLRTGEWADPRTLGGRSDAVQDLWTGRPERAPLPPAHRSQAPGESLRPHRRGYDNGTGCFASRVASDGHLR